MKSVDIPEQIFVWEYSLKMEENKPLFQAKNHLPLLNIFKDLAVVHDEHEHLIR